MCENKTKKMCVCVLEIYIFYLFINKIKKKMENKLRIKTGGKDFVSNTFRVHDLNNRGDFRVFSD